MAAILWRRGGCGDGAGDADEVAVGGGEGTGGGSGEEGGWRWEEGVMRRGEQWWLDLQCQG